MSSAANFSETSNLIVHLSYSTVLALIMILSISYITQNRQLANSKLHTHKRSNAYISGNHQDSADNYRSQYTRNSQNHRAPLTKHDPPNEWLARHGAGFETVRLSCADAVRGNLDSHSMFKACSAPVNKRFPMHAVSDLYGRDMTCNDSDIDYDDDLGSSSLFSDSPAMNEKQQEWSGYANRPITYGDADGDPDSADPPKPPCPVSWAHKEDVATRQQKDRYCHKPEQAYMKGNPRKRDFKDPFTPEPAPPSPPPPPSPENSVIDSPDRNNVQKTKLKRRPVHRGPYPDPRPSGSSDPYRHSGTRPSSRALRPRPPSPPPSPPPGQYESLQMTYGKIQRRGPDPNPPSLGPDPGPGPPDSLSWSLPLDTPNQYRYFSEENPSKAVKGKVIRYEIIEEIIDEYETPIYNGALEAPSAVPNPAPAPAPIRRRSVSPKTMPPEKPKLSLDIPGTGSGSNGVHDPPKLTADGPRTYVPHREGSPHTPPPTNPKLSLEISQNDTQETGTKQNGVHNPLRLTTEDVKPHIRRREGSPHTPPPTKPKLALEVTYNGDELSGLPLTPDSHEARGANGQPKPPKVKVSSLPYNPVKHPKPQFERNCEGTGPGTRPDSPMRSDTEYELCPACPPVSAYFERDCRADARLRTKGVNGVNGVNGNGNGNGAVDGANRIREPRRSSHEGRKVQIEEMRD